MSLSMAEQLVSLLQWKIETDAMKDLRIEFNLPKLNKHAINALCVKHAIFVPLCGTREFDILVSVLARMFDRHSKQTIKRALAHVGDRCNTAGHVKVTRSAQRMRDPYAAKPTGAAKGAGPNRKVRRANRMIKV